MLGNALLEVAIGVDPGKSGAIATLIGNAPIVKPAPIIVTKVRKRTKKGMSDVNQKEFDMVGMLALLKPFQGQKVTFAIEAVGVTSHDGKASMFDFGEGYGYWKMAAVAMGFKLVVVRPQEWKKHYPEMLDSKVISDLRETLKGLRVDLSSAKDKKQKASINKQMADITRQVKYHSKDAARLYAAKLYPEIADEFKLKKDDGKAEAVLIARYAKEKLC